MKVLTIKLAILLLSLEGISAQAPGDESTECIIPEDQPPENRRVLMESRYYGNLLPGTGGSPVWTAQDEDNDSKTVRVVNNLLLIA